MSSRCDCKKFKLLNKKNEEPAVTEHNPIIQNILTSVFSTQDSIKAFAGHFVNCFFYRMLWHGVVVAFLEDPGWIAN